MIVLLTSDRTPVDPKGLWVLGFVPQPNLRRAIALPLSNRSDRSYSPFKQLLWIHWFHLTKASQYLDSYCGDGILLEVGRN